MLQRYWLYVTQLHVAGEMSLNIVCAVARVAQALGCRHEISLCEDRRRSIAWCLAQRIEV